MSNKSHASCSRCRLPFFSIDGHTMCFRCREDAAITSMGGAALFGPGGGLPPTTLVASGGHGGGGHAELYHCGARDCPQPRVPLRAELENTPAVDHETNQRCSFCQRAILGVRIVITKAGTTWVQVAAGAWIGVSQVAGDGEHLEVRCAGCLLPEV